MGGERAFQLLQVTPSIAITVLFSCNSGYVLVSLALLQKKEGKKKDPEEIEMGQIDLSQTGCVLRSYFFLPLEGETAFFTGTT